MLWGSEELDSMKTVTGKRGLRGVAIAGYSS